MSAHDYNVSKVTQVNISHYPPKLKWLRGKIFNIHILHSLWSEFTRNISISAAEGLRAKLLTCYCQQKFRHDDVIKWKHFPRYWAFVRGIHRSPMNTPYKGQWRGAVMLFFDLRLNTRLSKHWWGWRFETPSCPLCRHCNGMIYIYIHNLVVNTWLSEVDLKVIVGIFEYDVTSARLIKYLLSNASFNLSGIRVGRNGGYTFSVIA